MMGLTNIEASVAHLSSAAFASRAEEYGVEPSQDAVQVADRIWNSQWRCFLDKTYLLERRVFHYGKERAEVPFVKACFGQGARKNPDTLAPEEHIMEAPLGTSYVANAAVDAIGQALGERISVTKSIYGEPSILRYVRIYPFSLLLEKIAAKYPNGIRPRLTHGLVTGLDRVRLFILGELPISFVRQPVYVDLETADPAVVSLHDLFHLLQACRHDSVSAVTRTLLYAAMITFSESILSNPVLVDALNNTIDGVGADPKSSNFDGKMILRINGITDAAKQAGAGWIDIHRFLARADEKTLIFTPSFSPV